MYIAVIQNNPKVGALKENAVRIIDSIDSLASSPYPPDLVVFPAYALTGTPVNGLQYADAFAAETLEAARYVMERAKLTTLVGTMIPRPLPDERAFVSEPEVLYCKDGTVRTLGFIDMGNTWTSDNYAASITTVIDGCTVSILLDDYPEIDEDYSASDVVIMMLAKEYRGTNTMFTASEQLGYLRSIARKNNAWVIVVNLVGAQDTSVFDGASIVVKPDGSLAAAASPFIEDVITYNMNTNLRDSRTGKAQEQGCADECLVKPLLPYEADWRAIELFIRDYVHKNGFSDVVLGLSGGIDSAVCAALACDALGSEHVQGVLMPGPYSSKGSIDDALALASNLGIKTTFMPIEESFKACMAASQEAIGQEGSPLAQQNIQARIRMTYLMHLSNTFNWLLLNTGNKSEVAMGFSTLYGDTAGALAPLGNTYKTDVYGLANWRNEQSWVIPEETLSKPPSAELYEGQTDQDTLPPYELLDHVLRLHIEEGLGVDEILEYEVRSPEGERLTSELVEGILDSVTAAEFKRRQEPPAPTLRTIDMCLDRDWPITNGFRDRHHDLLPDVGLVDYLGMIDSWKRPGGWGFLAN